MCRLPVLCEINESSKNQREFRVPPFFCRNAAAETPLAPDICRGRNEFGGVYSAPAISAFPPQSIVRGKCRGLQQ